MAAPNETPAFTGPFASMLTGWIAEQRALGYHYTRQVHDLHLLDQWSITMEHRDVSLPQSLGESWIAKRPHEKEATRQRRVILWRGLAQYMRRQGISAWSPPPHAAAPRYLPHIFTRAEMAALFAAIDACAVDPRSPYRHWGFPVLFRLLYGTGVRISEALALTYHDFDSKAGMIHIRYGKGDKERRIPVHAALVARLEDYVAKLPSHDPDGPLFPNPRGNAYTISAIYGAFRRFLWAAGISHGGRGKGPRLHDVRHTYVVHCLQGWIRQGTDLTVAVPYLSAYLGHAGLPQTQYYLRLTAECYPDLIAQIGRACASIIPGGGGALS